MSEIIWLFSVLGSFLTLALVILIIWKGRKTSLADADDLDDDGERKKKPTRGVPVPRPGSSGEPSFRRVRNRRARRQEKHIQEEDEEDEDAYLSPPRFHNESGDEDDDDGDEDLPGPGVSETEGKIGAKKRRKLEMKAEKKLARERELAEREERKQRQAMLDEERRKKEEAEKEEERKREEEEKRIREEKERQEHEEYLKMKQAFEVEEEGFDQDTDETEQSNKLQAFIEYIKKEKVVLLEDLAGTFQMKTQDAINRLNLLLEEQELTGVIDDRGKFIYITQDELENVAKFIRRRGRVALGELVENSNQLIHMKV